MSSLSEITVSCRLKGDNCLVGVLGSSIGVSSSMVGRAGDFVGLFILNLTMILGRWTIFSNLAIVD